MKYSVEVKPDKDGYYRRDDALFLLKQKDPNFCPGPVSEALKNHEIPHKRSSNKKKARISVRLEDILKWMKQNCNVA